MSKLNRVPAPEPGHPIPTGPIARNEPMSTPVAGLWALILSGPILLVVAGLALLVGMPLAQAIVSGVIGQSLFVLSILGISARNRTLNARDAARYWGDEAQDIVATGPPYPYLQDCVGRQGATEVGSPRAEPGQAASAFEPQWWVFPARKAARRGAPQQAAACISRPTGQSRLLCEWLADLGLDAHHCADVGAMLGAVTDMPGRWALVIVDLDHLGNLEDAIEDLLDFRETSPSVPVILISTSVARDDLSAERLNIADATLRKPVFARSFAASLATVHENNGIWQARQGTTA